MKKIFSTMIFALVIFVGAQVQARDVYVGTSNTTGRDCYLMTETVREYRKSAHGMDYDARLKMVRRSDGNVQYLDYHFHDTYFENSQGFSGTADQYKTPIEWNMFRAIQDYLYH